MHRTAWTKNTSSVPSDRIPPPRAAPQPVSKGSARQNAPQKSSEVRQLERRRDNLRAAQGRERDPEGGCFCQARLHALSAYTPICRSCGLVLCALHPPHLACPHCAAPLLTPSARDALLHSLDAQIADTLAQEEAARERAIADARAAAGAFPALSPASARAAHPEHRAHKVLSLNSKTKEVTVSSYRTPPASRPPSRAASRAAEAQRVPAPPAEVPFASGGAGAGPPWANLRGGGATYVPAAESAAGSSNHQPSGLGEERRGKGKSKEDQAVKEQI